MKKKNLVTKGMAMLMACAMVVGNTGIVAHAYVADDGTVHSDNEAGGGGSFSWGDSGSSSGSSSSSSSSSNSSNSGSSSNYDDGLARSENEAGGGGNYSFGTSDNGTASVPTGLATKGNTASIQGYETFRQIYMPADGKASIYHKGIEQYTAQLKDADGNAVAYKYASPYKDETTGQWYLNIVTADGVDTTGYTIGTYKGSVTYLPKLGMSGVMLNQVLMVDATAE